jgi:hypothetical protein
VNRQGGAARWLSRALRSTAVVLVAVIGMVSVALAPAALVTHAYDSVGYSYDAPAELSSPDTVTTYVRGSPERPGAVSWGRSAFVRDDVDAANSGARSSNVVDDVMAETLGARQRNITSSYRLTADEALTAGQRWVGHGYAELGKPGSGVFRSVDGTRQFRMDANSLMGNHPPRVPHVHLEIYAPGARVPSVNNHIRLVD